MNSAPSILLPTAYLGSVSYYSLIKNTAFHTIEKHENYIKQTIRNRCTILGSNGMLPLTIPIDHSSGGKIKIADVKIFNTDQWQRIHWNAILSSYNSSPFFEYYEDAFKPIYETKYDTLFEFNNALHLVVLKLLRLKSEVKVTDVYSSGDGCNDHTDYRVTKNICLQNECKEYYQVFSHKWGFQKDLSIIDLLCNEGPRALEYL